MDWKLLILAGGAFIVFCAFLFLLGFGIAAKRGDEQMRRALSEDAE